MRWLCPLLLSVVLTGCGVKKYLPAGPATNAKGRAKILSGPELSGVSYTGEPLVDFPVLPLQVWGVTYDVDLVLVSEHPRYNMHEYARVKTPDGDVWLAKDALEEGLEQSLIADIDDINGWVPELPVVRRQQDVKVTDNGTDEWLDLDIAYTNLEGEPVVIHYEGKTPRAYQGKRNGNTMGHSADIIMAALDIPYKNFAKRASVNIAGEDYKISKLLGLVKLQVVLQQTQGGLSSADVWLEASEDENTAFVGHYLDRDGGRQATDWSVERTGDELVVTQAAPFRTLRYIYRDVDGAHELVAMEAMQFARDLPATHIEVRPALPDMRRKFSGTHTSRFVVDVNGQRSHAFGRLEAWWDGDVAKVRMIPEEPYWTADRPMGTTLEYGEGRVEVLIERIPVAGKRP